MLLNELFEFFPKPKRSASFGKEIGKYPFFTSSNIIDKYNDLYDYDGEFLIIGDGGTGNCKYFKGKFSASDHNYLMKPLTNCNPIAVKYFLMRDNYKVLNDGFKGVGIKNISKSYIQNIDYKYNEMYLETEIVENLHNIETAISINKSKLLELDELIKSRFIEMFGEDLKGETIRLGDLCEVITKGTTPTTLGFDFVDEGVNFVKIECITEGYEFLKDKMLHITEECDEKLKRSKLKENDVLFSIAGAIGRTAIVSKDILPANTNQALAIIRLKDNSGLNVKFLNEMLHTDLIVEQVDGKKNGVAQTNLSLTDIGNFNVITPTMEKQIMFEKFVEQIDKLKFILQKQIKLLEELLDKKMNEYFGD